MIRINDVLLPLEYSDKTIKKLVCNILRVDINAIDKISLYRRSIDARKKHDIHFTAAFDVYLNINENDVLNRSRNIKAQITKPYEYILPECKDKKTSPLIVGSGPAGLFAALILAQTGCKPILIEQGMDVDTRVNDVNQFWKNGKLKLSSNVQFGEGGAGTFSDGKLNTGTKDTRARHVLNEFVTYGAPKEILYNAKPHIGTDNLRTTIKNIRNKIISLGGQVYFNTKFIGIKTKDGKVCSAIIKENKNENIIETENIILAIGHSARDTFEMIYNLGLPISSKPFSIGARIEHLRERIDFSLYGKFAGNKSLGSASYKLNTHLKNGRGVYTFCMCPGGVVVAAASEENTVVTNGMSEFARDNINSNSALLVGVTPNDYESDHPLAGMYYQRNIEQKAFVTGGGNYNAPVQRVEDFLNNKISNHFGDVKPTFLPKTEFANLADCLPEYITLSLREGIVQLNKRLSGFSNNDALLTGVETRSSSPIRIIRDSETMEAVTLKGLYPCGEGAGYAGGIISAAVDGIKCAEKIILK